MTLRATHTGWRAQRPSATFFRVGRFNRKELSKNERVVVDRRYGSNYAWITGLTIETDIPPLPSWRQVLIVSPQARQMRNADG